MADRTRSPNRSAPLSRLAGLQCSPTLHRQLALSRASSSQAQRVIEHNHARRRQLWHLPRSSLPTRGRNTQGYVLVLGLVPLRSPLRNLTLSAQGRHSLANLLQGGIAGDSFEPAPWKGKRAASPLPEEYEYHGGGANGSPKRTRTEDEGRLPSTEVRWPIRSLPVSHCDISL